MSRSRLVVTLLAVMAVWLSSPAQALACSTCYGQADGPMIDAANLGTFLLLGVVLFVQIAFAAFFLYLRRQAARHGRITSEAAGPGEWRSA
jgi:hypothetical protein